MLVGNQISLIDEFLRNDNFTCSFTKKIKNFLPFFLVFFPKVKVYKLPARYNYDMSTTISMSSKNLLRDPFEQQTVYIGQSQIHPEAGEGLFAKRSMPSGALLAIFNGIRLREITGIPFVTSNYKISVDRGLDLDIPDWAISAKKYSATLGHKCCHSFSPNAEFLVLEHAR